VYNVMDENSNNKEEHDMTKDTWVDELLLLAIVVVGLVIL